MEIGCEVAISYTISRDVAPRGCIRDLSPCLFTTVDTEKRALPVRVRRRTIRRQGSSPGG